jgi:hypothetical protein
MLPKLMKCISTIALSAAILTATDLSSYRGFIFGMNLPALAKQADIKPSEAKAVHQRPELIQELEWQPRRFPGPSAQLDSVDHILFSFYDGQLFRMLINYDRSRTEGLTLDDMIEAISAQFGPANRDPAEVDFPSAYNKKVTALARWEDEQYAFSLIHSAYQPGFALVALSKRLDALAQTAAVAAMRLDDQEAPQREINRQRIRDDEARLQQDKARLANKPGFRP